MELKNNNLLPLQNIEFRYFLSMRVFITLAFMIQYVVTGWEIYSITKDPLSLGLIGLAEAIPAIGIALYAGHLADIGNKRNILIISMMGMLLSSGGLLLATSDYMRSINSDDTTVMLMYGFIFTTGLARGFYAPTGASFIAQIIYGKKKSDLSNETDQSRDSFELDTLDAEQVKQIDKKPDDRDLLVKASTINSTVWQMSAILGPALGGFIFAGFGITISLVVVLFCIAAGIVCINFVQSKPIVQLNNTEPIYQRLKEGVKFVFDNKIILNALALDMFSVLFGGAVALLPVFADEILKVGPQGLGMLRAAPSVGAAITMTMLSLRKIPGRAGITLLWAVTGFGITIILFGISENFYLSLFLLFLNGAFDSVSVVIRANIIQLLTPDQMRGRVSAVNTMFIGSSNEIGAFESGVAAKLMGTVPSVIFGGTVTLLIVGFTAVKAKVLQKFDY
ncbi:MAG: MFS transporter [Chitinophagales bacterium]|nr:MFS transporter [Chitinophagales bacterium]